MMLLWLFMVVATRNMNEFKDEELARINEKFNVLKTDILAELKNQIKKGACWSALRRIYKKSRSRIGSICASGACLSLSNSS